MRIGIDVSFLRPGPRFTGMGVYTLGLLRGLSVVARDHEIHLLGYGDRPAEIPAEFAWHPIKLLPASKAALWVSHQISLPLLAHRLKLDVLHIPGVNVRLSQPGIPFLTPCPTVITVHDAIPVSFYGKDGPPLPWRLRWGYRFAIQAVRRAAGVITVSETSLRDIRQTLPLDNLPVTVVHNGLPPARRLSLEQQRDLLASLDLEPPFVLYVGSYEPRKNVVGAVEAYRRASERTPLPPVVLIVEADSGHKQRVLDTVAGSPVVDRLLWRHSVSDDQLAALYMQATVFIYPSFYEGFGFTPLQALSYGVPAIAGDAGAAPEVLDDAALLVNPADTDGLAAALTSLATDPALQARYREAGPRQAARFTWERAAEETLTAYAQAAGPPLPQRVPSRA